MAGLSTEIELGNNKTKFILIQGSHADGLSKDVTVQRVLWIGTLYQGAQASESWDFLYKAVCTLFEWQGSCLYEKEGFSPILDESGMAFSYEDWAVNLKEWVLK